MQTYKGVGAFIQQLRIERKITSEQLAQKLSISEQEVLEWESGQSAPGIQYLEGIASYFKISLDELLEGRRHSEGQDPVTEETTSQKIIKYALETQSHKYKNMRRQLMLLISAVMLLIILSSFFIDFIITRSISWSGVVGLSIFFVWLTILPLFFKTRHPIKMSMISLSAFVIPYLIAFDYVLNLEGVLMKVAVPVALSLLIYVWGMYYAYRKLKLSWMNLGGLALVGAGIISLVVNLTVANATGQPFFTWGNIWLSFILLASGAGVLYLDYNSKKAPQDKG